jgi:hypothetical protein
MIQGIYALPLPVRPTFHVQMLIRRMLTVSHGLYKIRSSAPAFVGLRYDLRRPQHS